VIPFVTAGKLGDGYLTAIMTNLHPIYVATQGEPAQGSSEERLSGGKLLSAISTSIVKLVREHYGRGPIKAKTYALDDIVLVVMRGSGFTPLEQTMMDSPDADSAERVVAMREDFQRMMTQRYRETIERLTGRKVLAFLSQAHVEPDITMEVFFVDEPLDGFGAVEVIDDGRSITRKA
jgi:uncharacterized protein YbcI